MKVNNFLGCMSLKTGVFLIGLLGVVLLVVQLIFEDLIEKYHVPINYIDVYENGIYD
jgi:hypothetical protein